MNNCKKKGGSGLMYNSLYRYDFGGAAVGRVERNQNFTASLGFYHNEYQIQYIFGGERYFFADGTCYKMEPGCIALIDKKAIAKTCIIGGQYHDRMLIELEEKSFLGIAGPLGLDVSNLFTVHHGVYYVGDNDRAGSFLKKVEQIVEHVEQPNAGVRFKLAVLEFLVDSPLWDGKRVENINDRTARSSAEKQKRVHEVADYIADHYAEITSVDQLSERFFMSKSYLCRIFREVTNFTISEYVNLYRIAASKEYLVDERYSMTEIANLLGYDSLTYFERVFKKQMSISPLQFRKNERTRQVNIV